MAKPSSRIPLELQAVFLASNRGEEVHTPPPGNVAFRRFQSILFRRGGTPQMPTTGTKKGFFEKITQSRHSETNHDGNDRTKATVERRASTSSSTCRESPVRSKLFHYGSPSKARNALSPSKKRTFMKNLIRLPEVDYCEVVNKSTSAPGYLDASESSVTYHESPVRPISRQYGSPFKSRNTLNTGTAMKNLIRLPEVDYHETRCAKVNDAKKNTKKEKVDRHSSPQAYLDAILKHRGYSKKRYYAHKTGYHNATTRTQRLSYHAYIVDLVKDGKVNQLQKIFGAGLSANPANVHGEGLVNLVCRLGASDILNVMIEAGCDVQVSDDTGRTPMHDACCCTTKSAFEVASQLIKIDPHLLYVMDDRGSLPLSYVKEKDYEEWIRFLKGHKNEFWPAEVNIYKQAPPLSLQLPFTRPIPEPRVMLPSVFVGMLASGRMSPEEATMLHDFDDSTCCSESEDDSSQTNEDDDDDDDEEDDDDEDDNDNDIYEIDDEEAENDDVIPLDFNFESGSLNHVPVSTLEIKG